LAKSAVVIARTDKQLATARTKRYHLLHTNVANVILAGCDQLDTLVRRWQNDVWNFPGKGVYIIDTQDNNMVVWTSRGGTVVVA
jgi:hypothetical protein